LQTFLLNRELSPGERKKAKGITAVISECPDRPTRGETQTQPPGINRLTEGVHPLGEKKGGPKGTVRSNQKNPAIPDIFRGRIEGI